MVEQFTIFGSDGVFTSQMLITPEHTAREHGGMCLDGDEIESSFDGLNVISIESREGGSCFILF